MKWLIRNMPLVLLVVLTLVIVSPTIALWWFKQSFTFASSLPIWSVAALWVTFLYHRVISIRIWYNMLLAQFSHTTAIVGLDARFSVSNDITYDQIIDAIRGAYSEPSLTDRINSLSSETQTVVFMDGWSGVLTFSARSAEEYDNFRPLYNKDLRFKVPGVDMPVYGAKRLLEQKVLPMLDHISVALDMSIEAIRVTVRFDKGMNPYLSRYFQNVELGSISALTCVLHESAEGSEATITRDGVTLSAARLIELNRLTQKHLSLGL